ncbi:maltokinase N-terminal cap-like domain-containing protein [Mycolicibacterium frederiksbergense]|nr:hypothetical protein [Mycolicibacterium frederiksbergense]
MAVVHRATLTPHKFDLITRWLPSQPWFDDGGAIETVSSFRFDDPDGEVGIETFIVRSGEREFHVPVTYRSAPLPGGTLVGELEHSVLGHRWVYDGPTDEVYVSTTTLAIVTGGHEVEVFLADGTPVPRADTAATVSGTGRPGDVAAGDLVVARSLPADAPAGAPRLQASWPGRDAPVALAWLV